jgi:hypothetical protein
MSLSLHVRSAMVTVVRSADLVCPSLEETSNQERSLRSFPTCMTVDVSVPKLNRNGTTLQTDWLKASIAGFDDGVFVEAHMLDAKTARKVPKKMIGRVLSPREVSALLDRLS